jgi:predicted MFS family arabinose efflux permease
VLELLRTRNFSFLWLGGLVSLVGDWALVVALPFEVYRRTDSTLATAGILLASLLPAFLFGSAAGVFVDRWDRRRLMIVVNVGLAVTLLPLLAVDALGIWIVYVVLVAAKLLEQLFVPAEVALLPRLVRDDQLVAANSMSSLNRNLARLIGPMIGGLVVALGGLAAVVVVDAATFLVAALLIALISPGAGKLPARVPSPVGDPFAAPASAFARALHEWRDGLGHVMGNPSLRPLLGFYLITAFGEGVVGALFVPWVSDVLGADSTAFAALLSAQAAGGIIGAIIVARFLGGARPALMLSIGAITFGLIDLFIFGYPLFWPIVLPAIVGMVLVGIPATAMTVGMVTLQQTLTSDSHRGRAVGLFGAVFALGAMVGTLIAGLFGQRIGILQLLVVQGLGYALAGLLLYFTVARHDTTQPLTEVVEPLIDAGPGPQAGSPPATIRD